MADFTIKQGDTSPAIKSQLSADGSSIDLFNVTEVRFLMKKSGTLVVDDDTNGAVSITDAANGIVKYEWQSGDTDNLSAHEAEWEVEYSDGTKETFPNDDYIKIKIKPDLDNA